MGKASSFLLGGVLLALGAPCMAQEEAAARTSQFDSFKGDGYYWYKVDPETTTKPKAVLKPPVAPPASLSSPEVKPLSSAWLKANMPTLLDAAVDNPTKENVTNYMYAQRVLLDKAQNFSTQVKDVIASDPFLDENNRVPLSSFAQVGFMAENKNQQDAVMKSLATKAGIWVFLDEPAKCSSCKTYVNEVLGSGNGLVGMAEKYGFGFKKIYVNTPEGKRAAKRLNLKVTPTTVLVIPPNSYYLVSQGLMAQDTLQDRILIAARMNGLLSPKEIESVSPYAKGVLTTKQMDGLGKDSSAQDIMNQLRARITQENK